MVITAHSFHDNRIPGHDFKKVKNQLDLTKKFVKQKWLGIVWNFIKHFHSDQKIIFVDAGAVLNRPISPFYLLFLRYLEKLSQNFSRGSAGVEILICFKWRSFANIFSTTNADYCRHFVNLSLKFEKNTIFERFRVYQWPQTIALLFNIIIWCYLVWYRKAMSG